MGWSPRSWFGASWFGRWFGGTEAAPPGPIWSGKLTAEIRLTTRPVDVAVQARYDLRMAVETADPSFHVRA